MNKSKLALLVLMLSVAIFSGCSTVPLEPKEVSTNAKSFNPPSGNNAGVYVFRDSILGAALKKDIWIDHKCLGESAPNIFFYEEVSGNKEHKISTESEFSPNNLTINTESGKNYFVRQYIKIGAFVGGANLEVVNEEEAKKAITELDMAKKGTCDQEYKE